MITPRMSSDACLDPSEYEELLRVHGFSVLSYCPADPDCGAHTVWLTPLTGSDVSDS